MGEDKREDVPRWGPSEKTPKQETMWIMSGHEQNAGQVWGGMVQQEMRSAGWKSSITGGIACKQWGVIDNQEGSGQL